MKRIITNTEPLLTGTHSSEHSLWINSNEHSEVGNIIIYFFPDEEIKWQGKKSLKVEAGLNPSRLPQSLGSS